MKLSDVLGPGATINAKTINIINLPDDEAREVTNPGIEYGADNKAKWSPPLQQELSIRKDTLGPTPDADTTVAAPEATVDPNEKKMDQMEFMRKLIELLNR